MAVEPADSRGSIKEVAEELGINQSLLSEWKQRESGSKQNTVGLMEEQKPIKKLQKELKDTQIERDI